MALHVLQGKIHEMCLGIYRDCMGMGHREGTEQNEASAKALKDVHGAGLGGNI
jgi:hypothetical protein